MVMYGPMSQSPQPVADSQGSRRVVPLLLAGEERVTADALETLDPSTGRPLTSFAIAGTAEIDEAVDAARSAFTGAWGATTPLERGRLLARAAAQLRDRRDEFARLDALDGGIPLTMARGDVDNAIRYFEFFAGAADKVYGDTIPLGPGVLDFTLREPHGVCGVITPFNVPVQMMARSVAPALATGNAVVVKPAEQAPLAALELGRLLVACGLPPGTLSVVPGLGAQAGAHLAGHPGLDHLTFTGSLATGRLVASAAVEQMTAVTIEAGGKSPQIVFDDAPVDATIAAITRSALLTAGQVCSAGTRILVQDGIYDEIGRRLAAFARGIGIGHAIDDPDMGPLVSRLQQQRVLEAVATAVQAGTNVLAGGGAPRGAGLEGGFFVEPTVLDDVDPDAPIARDEVFGPVVGLERFGTYADALAKANDTEFGLVAGIWSRDLGAALELARGVRAGQVFINNYGVGGGVELPFGGYKKSGIGREKGLAALLEYTQLKNVCIRTDVG